MNRITAIIDTEILMLETEMEHTDKHVINTETLKNRVMLHINFDGENDETKYCTKVGFGQVIQSRLFNNGYRSVRTGLFVNVDRCESISYLNEIVKNADASETTKAMVKERLKKIRDTKLSGQIEFDISGNIINGLTNPLSEDEFMEMLRADAV